MHYVTLYLVPSPKIRSLLNEANSCYVFTSVNLETSTQLPLTR